MAEETKQMSLQQVIRSNTGSNRRHIETSTQ